MKPLFRLSTLAAGLLACPLLFAQTTAQTTAPTAKPAGATGQCKDGTYSTNATKAGACRGHKGVKEWYTATAATPAPAPAAKTVTTPTPAAVPSPSTQARTQSQAAAQSAGQNVAPPATQSIKKTSTDVSAPPTPGGSPNLVWVNTPSHVYHCYGTRYYGKTKQGSYMSEDQAIAQKNHGVGGKGCSK